MKALEVRDFFSLLCLWSFSIVIMVKKRVHFEPLSHQVMNYNSIKDNLTHRSCCKGFCGWRWYDPIIIAFPWL